MAYTPLVKEKRKEYVPLRERASTIGQALDRQFPHREMVRNLRFERPEQPEQKGFFPGLVSALGETVKQTGRRFVSGAQGLVGGEFSERDIYEATLSAPETVARGVSEVVKGPTRLATEGWITALGQEKPLVFKEIFGEKAGPVIGEMFFGQQELRPLGKQLERGKESVAALGGTKKEQRYLPYGFLVLGGLAEFFYKPVKPVFTSIAKETSEQAIETTLKQSVKNLPDRLAKDWASKLKNISNENEVERFVKRETKNLAEQTTKNVEPKTPTEVKRGQPSEIDTRTARAAREREAQAFREQNPSGGFFNARGAGDVDEVQAAKVRAQAKLREAQRAGVSKLSAEDFKTDTDRSISPDLQPLAEEARKYKSAEEFLKKQGDTFFHATARDTVPKIERQGFKAMVGERSLGATKGEGVFLYRENKQAAEEFMKNFLQRHIEPALVEAKVTGKIFKSREQYRSITALAEDTELIERLKKRGFVGIEGTEFDVPVTFIFEPKSIKTKSQLTDFFNRVKGRGAKSKPRKGELPELPKVPKKRELPVEGTRAERKVAPLREQPRTREDVALRRRLAQEQKVAQRGARSGEQVGEARARNIADIRQERAVRKEQLKGLRQGIEIRARKDKIIQTLKNTAESTERVKKLIVEHAKDALDPKDRGKAITMVQNAKTRRDLTKAFSRIDTWAEESQKKALRDEILKIQKQIANSPSIAIDYQKRIQDVLNDFELRGHRKSTLEKLRETKDFLTREAAKGNNVEIPRRVIKALETLNRKPFEQTTLNELKGALAEIELLRELGETKLRTQQELVTLQKQKVISEIEAQQAPPLTNLELIRPAVGERLTISQKARNRVFSIINEAARIDKVITPMDAVFDLLDGGTASYAGANFRFFKGQVDAGYGRYLTRKFTIEEPVFDLVKKYKLDDRNFERMGVVAAREQDGGMEKLVASGFTEAEVNAVKLTAKEQEVLDAMRKTFDDQFPEIQDVMRRVYNKPVEKVKNYFSFMTDWKAMDDVEVFERFGSLGPEQYGAPTKNVEIGFTKTRVGGGQKIKINALDVFLKHTDNTSYLLELGETTKTLGEIAASPEYARLVGDQGQLLVREWIDVVARKGGAAGAKEVALLDTLRRNVGAGILGLKLSTIAIQPTALIDGAGFLGARYTMRGVNEFSTNAEWRKFVANMPEIKDRMGGEAALRELTGDNWLQTAQRKGFIPLQTLDRYTAGMIAAGAYIRKMDELGEAIDLTKPYNKKALEYVQLAVRRTQSSGSFKDVPLAVSRGALTGNRSLDRAILQFQNFLLTRWSRVRHDALRAGIRTRDPKKAIPIITAIVMASLAASGVRLGVNRAQDFVTGQEDEDTIEEDLMKGMAYEAYGTVPFLGTAASMWLYDGEMFPILDAPKGVVSGLNRVVTSKSPQAKLRGLSEFAGSTGAMLGVPGSFQAEQLGRGLIQDEEPPQREGTTSAGLPELPKLPKVPKLPALPSI